MKKILWMLFAAIVLSGTATAQSLSKEELWDEANDAYINAQYAEAIKDYEQLLAQGYESEKLYLNLGNAYFKHGMNGKAILNYHKALKLKPTDDDIRYNLAIANTYVQDKIDAVPVFFLKRWFLQVGHSLSSNTWAGLSMIFFALMLLGTGTYLLLRRVMWQQVGFYGGLASLVLFGLTVSYAAIGRNDRFHSDEAIVMSAAAPVKSSPDQGSKDIFVLHEGTKVNVCGSLGEWREIRIADGNKGWIQQNALELIQ